ncbi:Neuropeptide-like 1 [Operophtera brumata]|uniref:Neuropeptide-like 1 n=1 Tax=Operophtera brumata TaxID=104452 RepID=A0A0L7LDB7_OPEBR|nr:Neuropeptide-like 1 [Operophtera brumata]
MTGTMGRRVRGHFLLVAALAIAFSNYIEQVASLPVETINEWPTFPRRNIAALARAGYLKSSSLGYKRSISTLAKNGQLPTFRSPYTDGDKQENEEEESSQEKRNMASIARLRSYAAMKRNVQALARDGYRVGRGQHNQQNEKRNIAAMARNGMFIGKRDMEVNGDEYYYPFYQNPIPPLSEIDGPFDYNELYDFQQSVNPDMFPPLSQVYKRSGFQFQDMNDGQRLADNWSFKRGSVGMPVHGLYRPNYVDPTVRTKRYILTMPDVIEGNDIENTEENEDKRSVDDEARDNFEKRHIGSLARLGLLPSFRFSGGRYSRSGRARFLWPRQELYRSPRFRQMKHSDDQDFGIREYSTSAEIEPAIDSDDSDLPPTTVLAHSHPTGRLLHRPLNNDIPSSSHSNMADAFQPHWQRNPKESPKFYYFRSLKVPYHSSGKRYLIQPAVDNILLRKGYRNGNLPSRLKNQ